MLASEERPRHRSHQGTARECGALRQCLLLWPFQTRRAQWSIVFSGLRETARGTGREGAAGPRDCVEPGADSCASGTGSRRPMSGKGGGGFSSPKKGHRVSCWHLEWLGTWVRRMMHSWAVHITHKGVCGILSKRPSPVEPCKAGDERGVSGRVSSNFGSAAV